MLITYEYSVQLISKYHMDKAITQYINKTEYLLTKKITLMTQTVVELLWVVAFRVCDVYLLGWCLMVTHAVNKIRINLNKSKFFKRVISLVKFLQFRKHDIAQKTRMTKKYKFDMTKHNNLSGNAIFFESSHISTEPEALNTLDLYLYSLKALLRRVLGSRTVVRIQNNSRAQFWYKNYIFVRRAYERDETLSNRYVRLGLRLPAHTYV